MQTNPPPFFVVVGGDACTNQITNKSFSSAPPSLLEGNSHDQNSRKVNSLNRPVVFTFFVVFIPYVGIEHRLFALRF